MAELLQRPGRRACMAGFGAGLLALPDWVTELMRAAAPPVRTALAVPRCLLERGDFIAPARGRFVPSAGGTVGGLHCEPSAPPVLVAGRLDDSLVVVSGQGGLAQCIAPDGREVWRRSLIQPRGLLAAGRYVLVGSGRSIFWLDKRDGSIAGKTRLSSLVNGFSLHGEVLAVAFRRQGVGAVCLHRMRGFNVAETVMLADPLSYPRGVYLSANALYVADTFGHSLRRYEGAGLRFGKSGARLKSFYPNSVRPADGTRLLVAEEHINQIGQVEARDLKRQPAAAGCWSQGRDVPLDVLLARVNEQDAAGESVCRARAPLGGELLAPNDAVRSRTALYVADTDNHRVVMYKNGTPAAVLSNFNEPVNVEILA